MPNMSYCRFQNTYLDLLDCYQALQEADSVEELMSELSISESTYAQQLFDLCKTIAARTEEEEIDLG
jgi:hypothetical protein